MAVNWKKIKRRLGKDTDAAIAQDIGVSTQRVQQVRTKFRIEPAYGPGGCPFFWTQKEIALLGTMSDRKVGELLGVPKDAVKYKRRLLNIAAHGHHRSERTEIVLRRIARSRKGVTCREIAAKTSLSLEAVRSVVDRLAARGEIEANGTRPAKRRGRREVVWIVA